MKMKYAVAALTLLSLFQVVSVQADTIDERAALALDAERAKAAPQAPAGVAAPARAESTLRVRGRSAADQRPASEFSLVALRGWDDALEATLVIDDKRVVGSLKYPTLANGWRLVEITQSGVVIVKGNGKTIERREMAFVGSEPYAQPRAATGGGAAGLGTPGAPVVGGTSSAAMAH